MTKQTIIKIVVLLLVFIIIGVALYFVLENINSDEIKFKKEYESLNQKKNDAGKTYVEIKVPKNNNVEYLTLKEVMEFLDHKTGILYFGFPECPWCRNAVPVLIDAAKEKDVNIYYYNALPIRDIKQLDEKGNIITTKKGTKDYYKLVDKLKDFLPAYDGLNDESIKRLYFPTVFFIKEGKILDAHEGTVDSQKDPYKVLTKKSIGFSLPC